MIHKLLIYDLKNMAENRSIIEIVSYIFIYGSVRGNQVWSDSYESLNF